MEKQQQDLTYFISFCVEQYKAAKGLSSDEVVKMFNQYKVMDFLKERHNEMRNQGNNWLVSEIDSFINKKKWG